MRRPPSSRRPARRTARPGQGAHRPPGPRDHRRLGLRPGRPAVGRPSRRPRHRPGFYAYFSLDGKATTEQRQQLEGDIDRLGVDAYLNIEEGYQGQSTLGVLALTIFAGLVTIGAAGIATGLAQADSEADLKTLAAVGAAPRVRRTLSGFQCGVVALMGVVLGSAAGILPHGRAAAHPGPRAGTSRQVRHREGFVTLKDTELYVPIAVPWDTLAGLLVLVPLGAALLAALVTKSSGALARRAAG